MTLIMLFMLQDASQVIESTRWIEPYEVAFECRMVGLSDEASSRFNATAYIAEGPEGGQAVHLTIDESSDLHAGVTLFRGQSAENSTRLSLSNDDFVIELPWRLMTIGSPSYREFALLNDRDSGNVVMAGPCHVTRTGGAA